VDLLGAVRLGQGHRRLMAGVLGHVGDGHQPAFLRNRERLC
jgi:hypothetical protein